MKKLLFLILIITSYSTIHSQDIIIKLNNDSIKCNVIEINDDSIKYAYFGEKVLYIIPRNIVQEIKFSSGRTQAFNTKINIYGESDWKEVQVTRLESDIEGLTKVSDVTVHSKAFASDDISKALRKAMEKLKREAAKNESHIVLIVEQINTNSAITDARVTLIGILYKY